MWVTVSFESVSVCVFVCKHRSHSLQHMCQYSVIQCVNSQHNITTGYPELSDCLWSCCCEGKRSMSNGTEHWNRISFVCCWIDDGSWCTRPLLREYYRSQGEQGRYFAHRAFGAPWFGVGLGWIWSPPSQIWYGLWIDKLSSIVTASPPTPVRGMEIINWGSFQGVWLRFISLYISVIWV